MTGCLIEPDDEEEDDVNDFEKWSREPGSPIKSYILDFEQRYEIAASTGQVAHNNKYMTKLFFEKGKFSEIEKYDILKEVHNDRNNFEGIKKAARTLMTIKEKKAKVGTYHTVQDGHDGASSSTYYAPQTVQPTPYTPSYAQLPYHGYSMPPGPVMYANPQYQDYGGWPSSSSTYHTDPYEDEDNYIWYDVENFEGVGSYDYDCGAAEIYFDNNADDEETPLDIFAAIDIDIWYDVDTE